MTHTELAREIVQRAGQIYEDHPGEEGAWSAMEAAYVELISNALRSPYGAGAMREALETIRKYCDENLGPSRSSLLNKIASVADAALAAVPQGQDWNTFDAEDARKTIDRYRKAVDDVNRMNDKGQGMNGLIYFGIWLSALSIAAIVIGIIVK